MEENKEKDVNINETEIMWKKDVKIKNLRR